MSDIEPKPMVPGIPKKKSTAVHPMTKTSAVPIRKETVRVTLKAPPQGGTGPTAPPAPLAPPTSSVPASAPRPAAPAPTSPLKKTGSSTPAPPAPAPTVRLQTGPGSGPQTKLATPAPTVKLSTPGAGPSTVPLAGGSSQPLPKATVQLTQTQPMDGATTPSQAATIRTADDDDSSSGGGGLLTGLSVVSLVTALVVLGVQLATASIWVEGDWAKLFE